MYRLQLVISALLLIFLLPVQAEDASLIDIPLQKGDQQRCVQQRVTQCLAKCDTTLGSDCKAMCEENAKNECRQAGE